MEEMIETQHKARLAIFELVNMLSVPMSLNAIVRLNVPDAIWQGGANTALTASQILAKVLPSGGGDAENLQHILRMLTSYGVFAEVLHDTDRAERKYSLTEIGKMIVTDADGLIATPSNFGFRQIDPLSAVDQIPLPDQRGFKFLHSRQQAFVVLFFFGNGCEGARAESGFFYLCCIDCYIASGTLRRTMALRDIGTLSMLTSSKMTSLALCWVSIISSMGSVFGAGN
ncbi:hypothetical protein SLEP1_g43508 [Rubroshorea leprosula]|uniref:O-methyltransferase dimerisation domain-containing protein n=1 Tax=Rubroshorea leprosula TaxID=152421 RepID=A0AAV5LDB5_9ROSI|nr:hypothetical protein SLEP1_g43508 [Rubroshorea leprosula]